MITRRTNQGIRRENCVRGFRHRFPPDKMFQPPAAMTELKAADRHTAKPARWTAKGIP